MFFLVASTPDRGKASLDRLLSLEQSSREAYSAFSRYSQSLAGIRSKIVHDKIPFCKSRPDIRLSKPRQNCCRFANYTVSSTHSPAAGGVSLPALAPQVVGERELEQCGEDEGRAGAHPDVYRLHAAGRTEGNVRRA